MFHARVDGDDRDVALVAKADVRDDQEDIRPIARIGFDFAGAETSLEAGERGKNERERSRKDGGEIQLVRCEYLLFPLTMKYS